MVFSSAAAVRGAGLMYPTGSVLRPRRGVMMDGFSNRGYGPGIVDAVSRDVESVVARLPMLRIGAGAPPPSLSPFGLRRLRVDALIRLL